MKIKPFDRKPYVDNWGNLLFFLKFLLFGLKENGTPIDPANYGIDLFGRNDRLWLFSKAKPFTVWESSGPGEPCTSTQYILVVSRDTLYLYIGEHVD